MLSKKVKYAIIALIKLAKEYNEGPLLIRDIADTEGIPKKFLEAILRDLKHAGILGSKKGRGGGYYLRKNPDDVNLADIMRVFDGPIAFIPCVTYRYYEKCDVGKNEKTCGVHLVFKEVRDSAVNILKQATLTEIIKKENNLKQKE